MTIPLPAQALAASLLVTLSTSGCGLPSVSSDRPRVLAPELVAAPERLPAITPAGRGEAWRTCPDLIQSLQTSKLPDEVIELPQFNAWSPCLSGALIAQGHAAEGLDPRAAGERLYRELDLGTVPSSLAQDRPSAHYRLSDFKTAQVEITPSSVYLRDKGFVYELRVLAVGDFRDVGHSEWLVHFIERSVTGGSYNRTAILVVDPAADGALVAMDALDALRGHSQ